jgi:hypothetical protein
MLEQILNAANLYDEGVRQVQDRRAQWLNKHPGLISQLKEIADYLNANSAYKQGFYVDTLHAFNEEINGTCADMPSVTFRSGDMPMLVMFKNSMGEKKAYIEEGFKITFNPTITGQVVVLLFLHHSELYKKPPEYVTLAVIDDARDITTELVNELLTGGIKAAFSSSFTGAGKEKEINEEVKPHGQPIPPHNVIGFKRYETTEKVK